jgi:hypothetical protein
MHIQSLTEWRQAKLEDLVESEDYDFAPRPARDVPQGERWAFTGHRSAADLIAEGRL